MTSQPGEGDQNVLRQQALLCQLHNAEDHLPECGEHQAPAGSNSNLPEGDYQGYQTEGSQDLRLFFNVVFSTHISPVSTDVRSARACYCWRILTCTVISPDFSNANVRGK